MLGADERILEREMAIFEALRRDVAATAPRVQDAAAARSRRSTCSRTLAEVAALHDYTQAAHARRRRAVASSTAGTRSSSACSARCVRAQRPVARRRRRGSCVHPHRAEHGRQVARTCARSALIVLLAQAGSFVPARAGASCRSSIASSRASAPPTTSPAASRRSWSRCSETARILHDATSRSLVVLDEIGRGTSTFDGLAHRLGGGRVPRTNPTARPQTLFATHYHELTDLADALPGVVNAHVLGARMAGRHRLPAQGRARALGSQLRHPGRAPRRPARRGRDARARDPRRRSSRTSWRGADARRWPAQPSRASSSACSASRCRSTTS